LSDTVKEVIGTVRDEEVAGIEKAVTTGGVVSAAAWVVTLKVSLTPPMVSVAFTVVE
jgi:hypothetical protein